MFFKYSEPVKQIIAISLAYLVKCFGFVFKTENSRPVAESRPVCMDLKRVGTDPTFSRRNFSLTNHIAKSKICFSLRANKFP
jgi:hypothetical protein